MNTTTKGRRNQRKTSIFLREHKFEVDTAKFSRYGSTDFFGLWDHIAIALKDTKIGEKEFKKHDVVFVQTKTNRKPTGKVYRKYNDPVFKHRCIFVWKDREKDPIIINM